MARGARRQHPVERDGAQPRGEHICWTYGSDREHKRVLTTFLLEGLVHNDRICYFGFGGSEARMIEQLRATDLDVADLLRSERLVVGSAIEAYAPSGTFEPRARLEGFAALAERTVSEGFRGLRVAAETSWLLEDPSARTDWPGYELLVDHLTARLPIVGMCTFDTRGADADLLRLIAGLHRTSLGTVAGSSTFRIHALGDGTLAMQGTLEGDNAAMLSEAIDGAADALDAPVIDLGELDAIDPEGMQAVARLVDAIQANGTAPHLTGVSPLFRRMWSALDLDHTRRAILNPR